MSDHPEHHALYLFMFECRSEQMKLCAVQTERAAGENCINGLITASREGNRHNSSSLRSRLQASNGKFIAARVPKVIEKSLRVRGRKIMNEDRGCGLLYHIQISGLLSK